MPAKGWRAFEKNKELRENFDPETSDRDAMRAEMRKQRDLREKKYDEVLTEEQMKKYKELVEAMRQRRSQGRSSEGQRGRGGN